MSQKRELELELERVSESQTERKCVREAAKKPDSMSNLSRKAQGSTSEAKSVLESSSPMAAKAPPAGEEPARDENAPSTSQGRQHHCSHHSSSSRHSQQLRQAGAASSSSGSSSSNNNDNDASRSHSHSQSQSRSRIGSATPMTQLNGPVMRIKRELNEIMQNPPPNCSAEMYKEDLFHWKAVINGPSGTAYEGGTFKLDIRFPGAYPFRPPQIRFITRIYHCNVDSRGVICLDVLNERWSPVMNIAKVLLSIWVLIGECNPNDPLVMGIADQYKCNRKEHDKVARYWTKRFAVPKTKSSSKFEQELMQSSTGAQQPDKSDQLSDQASAQLSDQASAQLLDQVLEPLSLLSMSEQQEEATELNQNENQNVSQNQNQSRAQDQQELETTLSSGTGSDAATVNPSRSEL